MTDKPKYLKDNNAIDNAMINNTPTHIYRPPTDKPKWPSKITDEAK